MSAKRIVGCLAGFSWGWMFLISLNHLFAFCEVLVVPVCWVGYLGWLCFGLTIIALGFNKLNKIFVIFLFFSIAGYVLGPFIEPPGDPLDHLKNTYDICDLKTSEIPRLNKGFWQYSMNSTVICSERKAIPPEITIRRIKILNGLNWGAGAAIPFLVAAAAGLPVRWAYVSVLIAFLFMGTNKFSYFSYYSFAPSFSSIWIYWLWISLFFFRNKFFSIVLGLLSACFMLPIILVNHLQEGVFLGFLVFIWIFFIFHEKLWKVLSRNNIQKKMGRKGSGLIKGTLCSRICGFKFIYFMILVAFFFVLPQNLKFQEYIARWFIHDNWQINQDAVFSLFGWHLVGKIWGFRVNESLGLLGFSAVILIPLIVWMSSADKHSGDRNRIIVLGILPFIVYCVPLFHFIWLSNCERVPTHIRYYYRICYSSLFWLPITYFLYLLCRYWESGVHALFFKQRVRRWSEKLFKFLPRSYYWLCIIFIIALSMVRSSPIYGKLDFILLDSKLWWLEWKPMITQLIIRDSDNIFTDFTTHYVLSSIFNLPTRILPRNISPRKVNDIKSLEKISSRNNVNCLINLHSYPSSWVPIETGHWSPRFADTKRYYVLGNLKGNDLVGYLRSNPPENCTVYY